MKTTFETSLDRRETSDFFKGNGIYFARGCDWGDHLYISNWQEMCSILRHKESAQTLLTAIFEDYVKNLKENYSDAAGLLSNISSYYALKHKNSCLSDNSYDLIEKIDKESKKMIGRIFRFLRKNYDKENKNSSKHSLEFELARITKNGCFINLENL